MLKIHTVWKDIVVFSFDSYSYLLQGRKNKFTRATSFRIAKMGGFWGFSVEASDIKEDDLVNANLWEQEQNDK